MKRDVDPPSLAIHILQRKQLKQFPKKIIPSKKCKSFFAFLHKFFLHHMARVWRSYTLPSRPNKNNF